MPAIIDFQIPETGIPELETTVPETTTTNIVNDLLHLEVPQEGDTETETAIATDHLDMIVGAEVTVREEIVRHNMVGRQVEK